MWAFVAALLVQNTLSSATLVQRRRLTQSTCNAQGWNASIKLEPRPASSPDQLSAFRQCIEENTEGTRRGTKQSRSAAATRQLSLTFEDSSAYEVLKAFNQQLRGANLQPLAFAQPSNTAEVSAVVKCCVRAGLRFTARNGGHSYEANSLLDGGVVIDLGKLQDWHLDKQAHTLTLGGGHQLVGAVNAQLHRVVAQPILLSLISRPDSVADLQLSFQMQCTKTKMQSQADSGSKALQGVTHSLEGLQMILMPWFLPRSH